MYKEPVVGLQMGRAGTAAVCIALLAAAIAGPAEAGTLERDIPSRDNAEPLPAGFNDRVITRPSRKQRRVAQTAESGGTYRTPSGATVRVRVSDAYQPDPAADQAFANLIDSYLHGSEISKVTLYIAPANEVRSLCGAEAEACYLPPDGRGNLGLLIIFGDGQGIEAATAHEYGHHIAAYRDNRPWGAYNFGPKRWATVCDVCYLLRAGVMGFGEANYFQDPAEGWAEAYAETTLPGSFGRIVDRNLFLPEFTFDRAKEATVRRAIRRDVLRPWRRSTTRRWRSRLRGSARRKSKRFAAPLDGTLRVYLRVPRGREFDLYIKDPRGRVLKKAVTRGSEKLRYRLCGLETWVTRRRIRVVVRRRRGPGGRFRVRVVRP